MSKTIGLNTTQSLATLSLAAALIPAAGALAADPAPTTWETSATAGATVTRGNSKTLLFTAGLFSQRKWDQNEVRLGLDGAYGKNDSVKNVEFGRIFGQYNRLFTERFYAYGRAELSHDAIAAVDYRLTLSPGAGYYFLKDEKQSLSVEGGPGFIFEKDFIANPKSHVNHSYITLRVAERYDLKLNDKTRIWQSAEWLPKIDEFKDYILNTEVGLETQLTKKLSFRTVLQDVYDNVPVPGRKKNDLKLVTGIAYKF